jgi:tRNA A-37 threonylcarbamoyl transferase component Bud32
MPADGNDGNNGMPAARLEVSDSSDAALQKCLLGLVMERVPGRDCREMKQADFRHLKEPAVAAFERLWEAGFVHGDVAPRNIMCANDGSVRLVDMGMARHVGKGAREVEQERLYVNYLFDKGFA